MEVETRQSPDRSKSYGLLATNAWAGIEDADVPAYAWSGQPFDTFAELLARLIEQKYQPITEVVSRVSARVLWAVVTLAEAVRGSTEGAVSAYSCLEAARKKELLDYSASMLADMKAIAPLLQRSAPFLRGRGPGTIDAFSKLLDRLLLHDPDVTNKEAWQRIPARFPNEVYYLAKDDTLEWHGKEGKSTSVSWSAFVARMTDARRRRRDT